MNNKVMYEVWGEDTFARENYLVGTFETQEKANKALKTSEKSVLDYFKKGEKFVCRIVDKMIVDFFR